MGACSMGVKWKDAVQAEKGWASAWVVFVYICTSPFIPVDHHWDATWGQCQLYPQWGRHRRQWKCAHTPCIRWSICDHMFAWTYVHEALRREATASAVRWPLVCDCSCFIHCERLTKCEAQTAIVALEWPSALTDHIHVHYSSADSLAS